MSIGYLSFLPLIHRSNIAYTRAVMKKMNLIDYKLDNRQSLKRSVSSLSNHISREQPLERCFLKTFFSFYEHHSIALFLSLVPAMDPTISLNLLTVIDARKLFINSYHQLTFTSINISFMASYRIVYMFV